jgi:DNA-binding CsgD family transcriptional regulator
MTLTDHERDALLTYARLGDYEMAARELGVSRHTLRNILSIVRDKLGANSTIQALWIALSEPKRRANGR